MILPTSYMTTMLLLIFSMLCWGSWANTQKVTGKWRFELYYIDFSIGVLVMAIILALTFGTLGIELSVEDNIAIAGKRNMALAVGAGAVFNLANMLLVAAITVSGMATAFPISIGLSLVIGVFWNYVIKPQGNPVLLFSGAGCVLAAILVTAAAYHFHTEAYRMTLPPVTRKKHDSSFKGILLSVMSGFLMGAFYPIVEMSKESEVGLGVYTIGIFFGIGVFITTFVYNLYFMNLPVTGQAINPLNYFKGKPKQHIWGILGGMIWCAGAIANFAAASAPKQVNIGPAISYALGQGATLISVLWGLLVWKEFTNADSRTKGLIALMLLLFVAGLTLVAIAPIY